MTRRRNVADGLPYRVYERHGERIYSIGYKRADGTWAFKYSCPTHDSAQVQALRAQAITESTKHSAGPQIQPTGGFTDLVDGWFVFQGDLPRDDARKRAESTLAENKREAETLKKAFGHLNVSDITRGMGHQYLQACVKAKRPLKGNKEIALAHLLFEHAIWLEVVNSNPFTDLARNRVKRQKRLVTKDELNLAVELGRKIGGPQHIVALALQTAYLCVRRSVEVRALTRDCITDQGILWRDGKNHDKPAVLIQWTPELKETIEEAKGIKRYHVAGTMYLFGNLKGQKYTKGGWKATLDDLMHPCVAEAKERGIEFKRFSLQDCRPMAATDKVTRGDKDTVTSLGHKTDKMLNTVYDRRNVKLATGARLATKTTKKK